MKKIVFHLALASVLCTAISPKVGAMKTNSPVTQPLIGVEEVEQNERGNRNVPRESWFDQTTCGIPNKYWCAGVGLLVGGFVAGGAAGAGVTSLVVGGGTAALRQNNTSCDTRIGDIINDFNKNQTAAKETQARLEEALTETEQYLKECRQKLCKEEDNQIKNNNPTVELTGSQEKIKEACEIANIYAGGSNLQLKCRTIIKKSFGSINPEDYCNEVLIPGLKQNSSWNFNPKVRIYEKCKEAIGGLFQWVSAALNERDEMTDI